MNHTCTAPIEENDLQLLLIIAELLSNEKLQKQAFFKLKHQNGKKICSGNPTFFRSITWGPLYLFSISWCYPFKGIVQRKARWCQKWWLMMSSSVSRHCTGNFFFPFKDTLSWILQNIFLPLEIILVMWERIIEVLQVVCEVLYTV
jgi:hypothetical protein